MQLIKWQVVVALLLCNLNYLNGLNEKNRHKQEDESSIYHRIFKRQTLVPPIQTINPDNFLRSFDLHPCNRECKVNDSRECYFNLIVDYHSTFSEECGNCPDDLEDCFNHKCVVSDGLKTSLVTINYMYPGPPIELCHNDTIIVDVLNKLLEPTCMHWHGLTQKNTPWMDGVPFITEYPIQPGRTKRYRFVAEKPGTYWYHSHYGMQRAWGAVGSMIFRQPEKLDPFSRFYDFDSTDQVILLSDWSYNKTKFPTGNLLINGKGHIQEQTDSEFTSNYYYYSKIQVKEKQRYRFRLIFAGYSACNIEFSIDNHTLLVIATDGNDLQPIEVESILLTSGERYDFILETNQLSESYWMRIQGQVSCAGQYQGAVLQYEGADSGTIPSGIVTSQFNLKGNQLNSVFDRFDEAQDTPLYRARNLDPYPFKSSPFKTFYIHINRMNGLYTMNGINFIMNHSISFLDAHHLFDDSQYTCNATTLEQADRRCTRELCKCPHMMYLPFNDNVELVLVNDVDGNHPMHLHGYSFYVVGQGEFRSEKEREYIERLDKIKPLPRNTHYPPLKDTVVIQAKGYTIMRFFTDNPGYWFFHCHIENHSNAGMAMIFKIGDKADIPLVPWDAGYR